MQPDDAGSFVEQPPSDDDLALAALDQALAELEEENRQYAREVATPSNDVLEYGPTWERLYQEGAKSFICTDRIPRPRSATPRGTRVLTHDRHLEHLFTRGLAIARLEMDWRRTG